MWGVEETDEDKELDQGPGWISVKVESRLSVEREGGRGSRPDHTLSIRPYPSLRPRLKQQLQ